MERRAATDHPEAKVRIAGSSDSTVIGRLLDDFNREFDTPTPGAEVVAERATDLIAAGEIIVLLAEGDGEPLGIAVVRLRPALFSARNVAYIEELYVVPDRRGQGFGRATLDGVLELARDRDCERIELGTEEGDVAARGLYESCGFTNTDGGELMFFYEREL